VYSRDIHQTHRENEDAHWKQRPKNGSIPQTEVTLQMRAILVDWMTEVAGEFNLKTQTLFLAVIYLDCVLESSVKVTRSSLQLVGVTCMLLAAKYEEVYAPLVVDFVDITDNSYTREEILKTERVVLSALDFSLTRSTIYDFLAWYLIIADVHDQQVEQHAYYLAEFLLPHYAFHIKYRPSQIAAAIVCLSKHTFNCFAWLPVFEAYTQYSKCDLQECIHQIYEEHHNFFSGSAIAKFTAARDKYSKPKRGCVSLLPWPTTVPL